jgi:hypothetical protein
MYVKCVRPEFAREMVVVYVRSVSYSTDDRVKNNPKISLYFGAGTRLSGSLTYTAKGRTWVQRILLINRQNCLITNKVETLKSSIVLNRQLKTFDKSAVI